jgi:hypothetical protein
MEIKNTDFENQNSAEYVEGQPTEELPYAVIDDRDDLYGPLLPHYLRIGDTQFFVPPNSITVTKNFSDNRIRNLRGKGSFAKENGYYTSLIRISIFFIDIDSINNELRPLLSQVRKCPFLPVENDLLNNVYKIEGLCLKDLVVRTDPSFPRSLVCEMSFFEFRIQSYILDEHMRTFSEMINWPLFRWYYSRNLEKNTKYTYLEPLTNDLDSIFQLKTANENDLKKIRKWRKTRDKVIKNWMKDIKSRPGLDQEDDLLGIFFPDDLAAKLNPEAATFSEEEKDQGFKDYLEYFDGLDRDTFEWNLDLLYKTETKPYQVGMDNWNLDGIFMKDLTVSFENIVTPLQLNDHAVPTFQFMGSQDVYINAIFIANGEEALSNFEDAISYASNLTREYHKEMTSGYLEFDHPLTRLFGVKNVAIKDMTSSTVEQFPGIYEIQLTLMAYNRAERKMIETQKLGQNVEWTVNENADWSWFKIGLNLNPLAWLDGETIFDYLGSKPVIYNFFENNEFNKDIVKQAIYDNGIMQSFSAVELYPDLELPTYKEVEQAGFKITKTHDGMYVDPDFFILYDNPFAFRDNLINVLEGGTTSNLHDKMGGLAQVSGEKSIKYDEKTEQFSTTNKEKIKSRVNSFDSRFDPPQNYEKRYTSQQIEASIVTKTKEYIAQNQGKNPIPESLPIAVAKGFDAKTRQFYSVGENKNAELGSVNVTEEGVPVMMTKDFNYMSNKDLISSSRYVGVMRVNSSVTDPRKVAYDLNENITFGINTLQYYYDKFGTLKISTTNFKNHFNFPQGTTDEKKEVKLIYTIMMYLGYENEFYLIEKKNSTMSSVVSAYVKKIYEATKQKSKWTDESLKATMATIPVPDYKIVDATGTTNTAPMEAYEGIGDGSGVKVNKNIKEDLEAIIQEMSQKYNVPTALIKGIIQTESGFNQFAVSHAGAKGYMQLMPATAKSVGVKDPFNARQNIEGGTKYIGDLIKKYNGQIKTALASYNWGMGNLRKNGINNDEQLMKKYNQMPRETQNYVKKVSNAMAAYQAVETTGNNTSNFGAEQQKQKYEEGVRNGTNVASNSIETNNFSVKTEIEKNLKTENNYTDAEFRYKDMYYDSIKYDKRNRLIRAFPTFFLTFVDEGQYIGTQKMGDQYFGFQGVQDITYINSRKSASSTLYLSLNNLYGNLTDDIKSQNYMNANFGLFWSMMYNSSAKVKEENQMTRNRNPGWYHSIDLKTGARVHFRMGYGANVDDLPVIINGTITSMQNAGEQVVVIVQDDGIELTNKIKADPDETTEGFIFSKQEPTEIIDELLLDYKNRNPWNNEEFLFHSGGIMHFGFPGEPEDPDFEASRVKSEINMNIYETTGYMDSEKGIWGWLGDTFGMGSYDEPGINVSLFDKSYWDMLNICASVGEDYIVGVYPFHFRNTVFMGKGTMPLKYGYNFIENADGTVNINMDYPHKMKTYKQIKMYDSMQNIVDNTIKAIEDNMYTVAIGTYYDDGKIETLEPMYLDTDIWPEKQRTAYVDTTLNAKGIGFLDKIPIVGSMLNAPFKWWFDQSVAIKITAAALKDFVKEMYGGYLTVMGDATTKPHDLVIFHDFYNNMNGPFEVREVTQIMNFETGFTTMIEPDLLVVNYDKDYISTAVQVSHYTALALSVLWLRGFLDGKGYKGKYPILSFLKKLSGKQLEKLKNMKTSRAIANFINKNTYAQKGKKKVSRFKSMYSINMKTINSVIGIRGGKRSNLKDILNALAAEDNAKLSQSLEATRRHLNRLKWLKTTKSWKLKSAGSKEMKALKAAAKAAKIAKIGFTAARTVVRVALASTGIGLVAVAIEMLITEVLLGAVGEFIDRWLFMRQACIVMPIKKNGKNYTAGINGHQGSVYGDSPDIAQKMWTNAFSSFGLGMLFGVDTSKYAAMEDQSAEGNPDFSDIVGVEVAKELEATKKKMIESTKFDPPFEPGYNKKYEKRVDEGIEAFERMGIESKKMKEKSVAEGSKTEAAGYLSEEEMQAIRNQGNSGEATTGAGESVHDKLGVSKGSQNYTGSNEVTTVQGSEGKKKYRVSPNNKQQALRLANKNTIKNCIFPFGDVYLRPAAVEVLNIIGQSYKEKTGLNISITSGYRSGDPDWHGTGFGVDLDTPNAGRINGQVRFPMGSKDKENLRILIDCCVSAGYGGIIHGDVDVIKEAKKKYPGVLFIQMDDHFNHLHCSYIK